MWQAKLDGILLAKFTVITAPTFGNIMENRCQHQHLFTVNTAVDTTDKIIAGAIDKLNRLTVADSGFKVDYLEVKNRLLQPPKPTDKDLVILTAAFLGKKTRLLDNLEFSRELNQEFSPELNQQLGQQSASDFNRQPTTASVKD